MRMNDFSRKQTFRLLAGCALLTGLIAGPVVADESKQGGGNDVPVLFDGKTLKNWAVTNFGGEGEVLVKDGVLILERGEPITGVHWVGPELPRVDYEITMQAKRVDGNDFFATVTFPVQKNSCSLVLGGWGGGVVGLSSINGSDASENETTDYFTFEQNRWYKIRLRVTATHIQAWIDDKQIANVDYSDKVISVRIEMELSKPLGLASFQTVGAIKDLKLKKLDPADEKQSSRKQEQAKP